MNKMWKAEARREEVVLYPQAQTTRRDPHAILIHCGCPPYPTLAHPSQNIPQVPSIRPSRKESKKKAGTERSESKRLTYVCTRIEALRAVARVQKERLIALYKAELMPEAFDLGQRSGQGRPSKGSATDLGRSDHRRQ